MLSGRFLYTQGNRVLNVLIRSEALRIRNMTILSDKDSAEKTKKKVHIPKVNILLLDKTVLTMTKEQMLKWAKRRDMTLTHLENPPKFAAYAGREVFKAFTKSEQIKLATADLRGAKDKEHIKTLDISSKIANHDFNIKLKQVKKWLERKNSVHIIIQGSKEDLNQRCDVIKEEFKTISSLSAHVKGSKVMLKLLPLETAVSEDNSLEDTPSSA